MASGLRTRKQAALRLGVAAAALTALAACTEDGTQLFKSSPDAQVASAGGSTRLVERDIEAPEVFQATEAGLWDGRPSLGGVWVAHPDVKEPERALIRNTANGKFVIGALFRPSLDRPGPRFQVSSDAAEALAMLAGQPMNLNVTALRREEVPQAQPEPDQTPAPVVTAESMPAPETVTTTALDPVPGAAAAIDRAEGATAEAAASATETAAATAEAAPAKRRFFWQKKAAEPVAEAPEAQAMAAAAPVAAAPAPAPVASPGPATAPAAASAASPRPASGLDKPYLQIGIFSVEQNARNTAVAMRQSGIIPTVRQQTSQGKTFWRVVVGPATTTEERAQLLSKVKAAGFTDAYAVTN